MGSPADGYVQVAADGAGKKVATQEFTRSDGSVIEAQQVLGTDPDTGRPLEAPPWHRLETLLAGVLAELQVLTALFASEAAIGTDDLEAMRDHYQGEIQ